VALTHLVDTSVLKRLRHPQVMEVVGPMSIAGNLGMPTICDLEIGYSARNGHEWGALIEALATFERIDTSTAHVERALQVQRMLAEQSQRGRKIPDLLVAAAAEAEGVAVLHYDTDFDLISKVTGQRCEWVVPSGTVD
jgi:predicted nucleic acid-binding protein